MWWWWHMKQRYEGHSTIRMNVDGSILNLYVYPRISQNLNDLYFRFLSWWIFRKLIHLQALQNFDDERRVNTTRKSRTGRIRHSHFSCSTTTLRQHFSTAADLPTLLTWLMWDSKKRGKRCWYSYDNFDTKKLIVTETFRRESWFQFMWIWNNHSKRLIPTPLAWASLGKNKR